MQEALGTCSPNWNAFLHILWMDRNQHGDPFSWLNLAHLWFLRFQLGWQPNETGVLRLGEHEIEDMTIHKALVFVRWVVQVRKEEAAARKAAIEKARAGR